MTYENFSLSEIKVFPDHRGRFGKITSPVNVHWVEHNYSYSTKDVFRGFHFQSEEHSQAKLVTVLHGEILDYIIDLRLGSNYFGTTTVFRLNANDGGQLYVPRGFAHAFRCVSSECVIYYMYDNNYSEKNQKSFKIEELCRDSIISEKDKIAPSYNEVIQDIRSEKIKFCFERINS